MIKTVIVNILLLLLLSRCGETQIFEPGTEKSLIAINYRQPDSIKIEKGIPDVYTNQLINIEIWYFGRDTSLIFADEKLQTLKINK